MQTLLGQAYATLSWRCLQCVRMLPQAKAASYPAHMVRTCGKHLIRDRQVLVCHECAQMSDCVWKKLNKKQDFIHTEDFLFTLKKSPILPVCPQPPRCYHNTTPHSTNVTLQYTKQRSPIPHVQSHNHIQQEEGEKCGSCVWSRLYFNPTENPNYVSVRWKEGIHEGWNEQREDQQQQTHSVSLRGTGKMGSSVRRSFLRLLYFFV